ncbi:MAG: CotH kinase family protein [Cytophagales bacterium]|tara:strand:+ start:940 stop:2355 length:1416 start_codon:yes stop_codon:yes gene_type:complete
MRKDILKPLLFILIIASCNSIDPVSDNPDSDNNNIDTTKNENLFCEDCIKSFDFEITTLGVGPEGEIVDEPKVPAALTIKRLDSTLYEGIIGIEIRGESSQFFDKKSYGFETWDSQYNDLDVALIGFPEEEDWILYGPFSDKSLIRNKLIYELSNRMGRYTTKTEFVELTINYEYKGLYIFMEKLKRDKNRIDISKLENVDIDEELISGGYIIKIDKSDMEDGSYTDYNSFQSQFDVFGNENGDIRINFNYEYPKPGEIHANQKNYIKNYFYEFESSLASNNFKDPINGFRKYIDEDSFIDFFILNELSNNVDGYRLSTYLQKDRNEKLVIGPIWDFNLSFGNADYCGGERYDVWCFKFNERCLGDYWNVPFWWNRLLEDEKFVDKLKDRWNQLRSNTLSDNNMLTLIEEQYSFLNNETDIINRNFNKWKIFGIYIWPNSFIGNNYYEEIDFLKNWIKERTKWLDESINNL